VRIFLIFANGICAVSGGFLFLYFLNYNFTSWVMANVSSILQVLVVIFLIFGKKTLMNVLVPFLLFYGGGGLFLFDWSSRAMPVQISHSIMVLTALYIIYVTIARWQIGKLVVGVILGIVLFVPFRAYEIYYLKTHPNVRSSFELFEGK